MRKRFKQQTVLGKLLIEDVKIPIKKRMGSLPALFLALQYIYTKPELNSKIFDILAKKIFPNNNHTGRPGMDLWTLFVFAQVRNCKGFSYDDLHYCANNDKLLRGIIGVENVASFDISEEVTFSYQTIVDNVDLLDDATLREINTIIVELGNGIFKKKEGEALRLKTDSFVVESNVHFPTDYNLLWDCIRKCLDTLDKLKSRLDLPGWRKQKDWYRDLKNKMRSLGQTSSKGGSNKKERLFSAATDYVEKSKALSDKLSLTLSRLPRNISFKDLPIIYDLRQYLELMNKHIDLVERRLIKGEVIPHEEKMFSIFETYTEWITKGKKRPSVELGKKLAITSNQYHLIVDYRVMDHQSDSQIIEEIYFNLPIEKSIASWSFDKGFWSKSNKEFLRDKVDLLVLPKKGRLNKVEYLEEHAPPFKKNRNRHSAIESNINELEHRGLDRCPDRGFEHFKRYIALGVCAYNLRKIGQELIGQQRQAENRSQRRRRA